MRRNNLEKEGKWTKENLPKENSFVVCIDNKGCEDYLDIGKSYQLKSYLIDHGVPSMFYIFNPKHDSTEQWYPYRFTIEDLCKKCINSCRRKEGVCEFYQE